MREGAAAARAQSLRDGFAMGYTKGSEIILEVPATNPPQTIPAATLARGGCYC
eukprot:SAG25_NODE_130_length_14421_cov_71.473886_6_plen_53_part_00